MEITLNRQRVMTRHKLQDLYNAIQLLSCKFVH